MFNAPVTAVTVGLQPGGAGVASLRFSSAGGDLFCGYAVAPLLAKTVTASLKDRFLAGIDATGCYERANGAGPALATGALSFAFTSSPGAAYPTGAGATVVYNPETGTFNPVQTLQSDGSAGPGGVVAGGDPGASDPPGDPFGNPFGNPDPTLPDPDAIYDPVAPSEAFSWSETVVAGDEALAAAVAATDVAGFASPDNMPPDLGDAYASDNILSDIPPVPIAPATAEGLSLAQIAGAAAMADPAAADGAPTPQQVAGGDAESGSLFDPPAAGAGPASAGDEAGEGATAAATPPSATPTASPASRLPTLASPATWTAPAKRGNCTCAARSGRTAGVLPGRSAPRRSSATPCSSPPLTACSPTAAALQGGPSTWAGSCRSTFILK